MHRKQPSGSWRISWPFTTKARLSQRFALTEWISICRATRRKRESQRPDDRTGTYQTLQQGPARHAVLKPSDIMQAMYRGILRPHPSMKSTTNLQPSQDWSWRGEAFQPDAKAAWKPISRIRIHASPPYSPATPSLITTSCMSLLQPSSPIPCEELLYCFIWSVSVPHLCILHKRE